MDTVEEKESRSADRLAGFGMWVLACLYIVHMGYAFGIGVAREQPKSEFVIVAIVAGVILFLMAWVGARIRNGGRLVGGILLSVLMLGGFALSAILAARSLWQQHRVFVLWQVLMVLASLSSLVLLVRAHFARDAWHVDRRIPRVGCDS